MDFACLTFPEVFAGFSYYINTVYTCTDYNYRREYYHVQPRRLPPNNHSNAPFNCAIFAFLPQDGPFAVQ